MSTYIFWRISLVTIALNLWSPSSLKEIFLHKLVTYLIPYKVTFNFVQSTFHIIKFLIMSAWNYQMDAIVWNWQSWLHTWRQFVLWIPLMQICYRCLKLFLNFTHWIAIHCPFLIFQTPLISKIWLISNSLVYPPNVSSSQYLWLNNIAGHK